MAKKIKTTATRKKSVDVTNIPLSRLFTLNLDLDGSRTDRPKQPFLQSEWVFVCVDAIIKAARSIQMLLSTSSEDIVESGPVYDLLFNDTKQPFSKFITETAGFLTLYRECYWVFLDQDILQPKKILVAGPEQVEPVIVNGILNGYKLHTLQGFDIPLLLEDLWPLLDFNPHHPYRGAGPAQAGKLAISTAYQAALMNEATLANGGKLSGIIVLPAGVKLDETEKNSLISQFETRHKGARNAGKWALMTGGADVKPLAQTLADLQMIDLRKYDAGTICSLFGVPPEVVGLNSEAQYAHGPAQQRFILNTISPLLYFIAENLTIGILNRFRYTNHAAVSAAAAKSYCGKNKQLKKYFSYRQAHIKAQQNGIGLFAWFNIEEHPTIQEMLRDRADKVLQYTNSGIPLNQIIDAYDLPFEQVPWGNDWWIGMGQVPARFALEAGIEGLTGPAYPAGAENIPEEGRQADSAAEKEQPPVNKDDEQRRLRIWHNWVISWAGLEREYNESLRKFFLRQQRDLLDKLKKAFADENKATKDNQQIIARVVFDMRKENEKIKIINQTFFLRASELGIRQSLTEVLGPGDKDKINELAEQAKHSAKLRARLIISTHKITNINKTTQNLVAEQLRQGLEGGEGLNELVSRVQHTLGSNRARALSIARTQTAGAVSSGRHEGYKTSGVDLKSWLTSGDENVRPAHEKAGKDYAKGIPVDLPFEVGGENLMYPGDPAGSAGNIIMCRCVEIARRAGGKEFDDDYYLKLKFYSSDDLLISKRKEVKNGT